MAARLSSNRNDVGNEPALYHFGNCPDGIFHAAPNGTSCSSSRVHSPPQYVPSGSPIPAKACGGVFQCVCRSDALAAAHADAVAKCAAKCVSRSKPGTLACVVAGNSEAPSPEMISAKSSTRRKAIIFVSGQLSAFRNAGCSRFRSAAYDSRSKRRSVCGAFGRQG